jgi:hypothetical protein
VWLFVYQWKALGECTTGIRWFALWAGNIAISGPVFIMVPEPLSTVTALYLSVLALGLGIAGLLAWSGCGKPAVGVESTVRVIGWIEAAAGLAIAAVSLPFLRPSKWEKRSEAGCLAAAAILMSIIGTVVGLALIVGGAWRALALPAIDRAQLVPVVGAVAAPVVLIVVLMAGGRGRPRWRR